jgi:hypothetical protein
MNLGPTGEVVGGNVHFMVGGIQLSRTLPAL